MVERESLFCGKQQAFPYYGSVVRIAAAIFCFEAGQNWLLDHFLGFDIKMEDSDIRTGEDRPCSSLGCRVVSMAK